MHGKIHLIAFLSGFDIPQTSELELEKNNSVLLDLKLKHGFEIRCDYLTRVAHLFSQLDNTHFEEAKIKLIKLGISSYVPTPNSDRYIYYITILLTKMN